MAWSFLDFLIFPRPGRFAAAFAKKCSLATKSVSDVVLSLSLSLSSRAVLLVKLLGGWKDR